MRRLVYIFMIMFCLCGCNRFDVDEVLLTRDDISLTTKGLEVVSYDPATYQVGHNAAKNEFWVSDDDAANWFTLTCDERPDTEGQEVVADLSWTETDTTKSRKGLRFTVMKTDPRGQVWLWCKEGAIGVVVKELSQ